MFGLKRKVSPTSLRFDEFTLWRYALTETCDLADAVVAVTNLYPLDDGFGPFPIQLHGYPAAVG